MKKKNKEGKLFVGILVAMLALGIGYAAITAIPLIINGSLRIVERTNLAYVEPHRVIIKGKLYLFFNEQNYFCIDSLENKYPLSKLNLYIE